MGVTKPRTRGAAGFSFIELVIVVAVLGILTALGIFFYGGIQASARQAAVDASAQNGARQAMSKEAGITEQREALQKLSSDSIGLEFLNSRTGDITVMPQAPYCVLAYNKQHRTISGDPQFYSIAGSCESKNPELPNENNEGRSRATLTSLTLRCEETVSYPTPLQSFKGTLIWSDGTSSYQTAGTIPAKQLEAGEEYTLKAYGTYERFGGPDREDVMPLHSCLRSVDYIGNETGVSSLRTAFAKEQVLESVASPPASVKSLQGAFSQSSFNSSLAHWDVSNVEDFGSMFSGASKFNQSLDSWNMRSAKSISSMFNQASEFNQPLNSWNTSRVESFSNLFHTATKFNQPLDKWDTSSGKYFDSTFAYAKAFDYPIGNWKMSNALSMNNMLAYKDYNRDISKWDVSNVYSMNFLFASNRTFNQDISDWKIGSLQNLDYIFYGAAAFDKDINKWDTSKVTSMRSTFAYANSFSKSLDDWDTSKVTSMNSMFYSNSNFNEDISGWDVSQVTDMTSMFEYNHAFSYDLSGWDVDQVTAHSHFNRYGSIPEEFKPRFGQ